MSKRQWCSLCLLLVGLTTVTGCQTPGAPPRGFCPSCRLKHLVSAKDGQAAPEPVVQNQKDQGGLLLKTGAIQLGPGVGANAYRWQGDGQWGFPGAPSGGTGMNAAPAGGAGMAP